MAETDPEDKITEVGAPERALIHTRRAHAYIELVNPGSEKTNHRDGDRRAEQHPVLRTRLHHGPQHVLIDFGVGRFLVFSHDHVPVLPFAGTQPKASC